MSPCFVHSNLDKGASFSEWLNTSKGFPRINVPRAFQPTSPHKSPSRCYRKLDDGQVIVIPYEDEEHEHVFNVSDYEDDNGNGSLTKRLAETAVGVWEMSKQLGTLPRRHHPFPLKCPRTRAGAARRFRVNTRRPQRRASKASEKRKLAAAKRMETSRAVREIWWER